MAFNSPFSLDVRSSGIPRILVTLKSFRIRSQYQYWQEMWARPLLTHSRRLCEFMYLRGLRQSLPNIHVGYTSICSTKALSMVSSSIRWMRTSKSCHGLGWPWSESWKEASIGRRSLWLWSEGS